MLRYSLTDVAPVRPTRLRFGILSAEEIRRMSVCEVTETALYYRGLPASGGLLDSLMGTVDRRHLCATCMRDARTCQGHTGHIELAFPVYHIGFIDTVLRTLRTTCFFCSRVCVLASDVAAIVGRGRSIGVEEGEGDDGVKGRGDGEGGRDTELSGKARLNALHAALRTKKTCPHCKLGRPTYARVPLGIHIEWPDDFEWLDDSERAYCTAPFTAREALSILQNLSDDDVSLLGFHPRLSHPANMIVQNLVVPPPCTRPAIYSSEGSRSRGQNELTSRLLEILRRSHELKAFVLSASTPSASTAEVESEVRPLVPQVEITPEFVERLSRLQYEVFLLVSSNLRIPKPAGMGRSGGAGTSKSLTDRLKGKEGRVRGNLMGKRVDFSARCVITPDAYFECDRVGVPYKIALKLTIPETVNVRNIQLLRERVRRGASTVDGASTVISRDDGVVTELGACKHPPRRAEVAERLRPGDVVERFLQDDDVVVFNRQPSLHMYGMQAHRVRLMPGHTFRLSLVAAAPYNADFDGDEMNLHVPQSKLASAECATLMAVAQNCVGSQSNRPVMGIVQDSLLGVHLLTQDHTLFDRAHACRVVGTMRHVRHTLPPAALVIVRTSRSRSRSKRMTGVWTGRQVFSMLLPPTLHIDGTLPSASTTCASEPASESWRNSTLPVVVRAGQMLCGVLAKAHVGTAAGGIVDVLCREFGGVACMRFMADVQRLTHAFLLQRGHHVGIDDVMLSDEGQRRVNERLAKATRLCDEIQREVADAPVDVVHTAERAVLRLLSKMLLQTGGVVNECMSDDNAIRRMVNAGSKGSFINLSQICASLGQQSLEGRRIVADKGSRTLPFFAHTDLGLASRGMVFNSFALGLAPTELFYHAIGGREGLVDTAVKTSQTGYLQRRMNKSMEDHTVDDRGYVRNSMGDVVSFRWGSDGLHPARVERVRLALLAESEGSIRRRFAFDSSVADEVVRRRREIMCTKTHVLVSEFDARVLLPFHPLRLRQQIDRAAAATAAPAASASTHGCTSVSSRTRVSPTWPELDAALPHAVYLAMADVFEYAIRKDVGVESFDALVSTVRARVDVAASTRGESVGSIAAQSIGEPCTQMTLNTFHYAGCSAKNVTMGIPRLKELIDASRTCRTPCTTVRFYPPFATSAHVAEYFASTLPLTRLSDVVASTEICERGLDDHHPWLELQRDIDLATASTYVIRFMLHQPLLKTRRITPPMVRRILSDRLRGRAIVTSSETNAVDWVIRIHLAEVKKMVEKGGLDETILCHRVASALLDTVLISGHTEIASAQMAESAVFRLEAENDEATSTSTSSQSPVQASEYVVHAYGHFLSDCVASECIDWTRCTSNDVWEVYDMLGVEACAHVLFDQLKAVVSFDGTYVDDRHMMLIVDTICRNGSLMPLNRHGINRGDSSPLMKCSFEETIDVLCEAALFAESENAKGVTASIMTGQMAALGTGCVDVLFPTHKHSAHVHSKQSKCQSIVPRGRVMRSTCRSFCKADDDDVVVEYVMDNARVARPASPIEGHTRKRARFRPLSPPL